MVRPARRYRGVGEEVLRVKRGKSRRPEPRTALQVLGTNGEYIFCLFDGLEDLSESGGTKTFNNDLA
jgi:hypothetical protein